LSDAFTQNLKLFAIVMPFLHVCSLEAWSLQAAILVKALLPNPAVQDNYRETPKFYATNAETLQLLKSQAPKKNLNNSLIISQVAAVMEGFLLSLDDY
jgi:hypothetical protein